VSNHSVFDTAFKIIANFVHPDHGGTDEAMRAALTMRDAFNSQAEGGAENPTPQVNIHVDVDAENPTKSEPQSDENYEPSQEEINEEPLVIDGVQFPRRASAVIRHYSVEKRQEWNMYRLKVRTDPIFCSDILLLDLVVNPHLALFLQLPWFRGPQFPMDQLDTQKKKTMILWSRGHAKTTCLRVWMLQFILNYPKVRICYLSGSDNLAKLQLAALKRHFEEPTEAMLELFPEFCLRSFQNKASGNWKDVPAVLGNSEQFSVPGRVGTSAAEPTFKISTNRSVKSGGHFDLLCGDDLVNDQNYQNETQLERTHQGYLDICPLLDPTGYLVLTGTRYSFGDTYEKIQETAKSLGDLSNWHASVRNCWSAGICTCLHAHIFHDIHIAGSPCVWPGCSCKGFTCDAALTASTPNSDVMFPLTKKRDGSPFGFTKLYLDQQAAAIGESNFANQYLLSPLAASAQQFSESMLKAQTISDASLMPPLNTPTYIVGDPAFTAGSGDETVFFVFSIYRGAYWVRDCVAGHWGANDLCKNLITLIRLYRPAQVFLEGSSNTDALKNLLEISKPSDMGPLPIIWTPASNRKDAKMLRIGSAQAYFINQRVWIYHEFRSDPQGYSKLVQQLCRWPRGGHDDRADALSMIFECPLAASIAGQQTAEQQAQKNSSWLFRLHNPEPIDTSDSRPAGSWGDDSWK
jgi:hypothetical protein